MSNNLIEFVECVTNNDKIVSKRLNRKYFGKIGKPELFDNFVQDTQFMHDTIGHCVKYVQAGYLESLPKCHCGNDIRVLNRKVSRYCCVKCALTSDDRVNNLKQSLSKVDKQSANLKRQETMLKKYGVRFNSQRDDIKPLLGSKLPKEVLDKLLDKEWLTEQYVTLKKTSVEIAKELGISFYGTVIDYLIKHDITVRHYSNTSSIERQVFEFVESLDINVETNVVGLFDDKREVDLYIPSHKLAIEVNGLWYHTEHFRSKYYHRGKKNELQSKGIDLIQFTDYDWKHHEDIIKSIIGNRLGKAIRIFARDTEIKVLSNMESETFLNQNHIKGYKHADLCLALVKDDEPYMIATFDVKGSTLYLSRSCSKLNYSVVGGFSKLVKGAIGMNEGVTNVFSYVDKDYFNGHGYIGWENIGDTDVGYFWTNGTDKISRYKCQNLSWLKNYDSMLNEVDNMHNAGYYRFWNSGNYRFRLNLMEND